MKVIFLLSLPRSGSTLVQRVLSAHPEISTLPEPWILLPHLSVLRPEGINADYDHCQAFKAISRFVEELPEGRATYNQALRQFAMTLYSKAASHNAQFFLDKTPRYHFIATELTDIFPDAFFLLLYRNPLAIASSIVETWGNGNWNLELFEKDLFNGLRELQRCKAVLRSRALTIRYEDFIERPAGELSRIYEFLGLPTEDSLREIEAPLLHGEMGDKTGQAKYSRVTVEDSSKWIGTFNTPFRRKWCRRYLDWIGRSKLDEMGYDIAELKATLNNGPTSLRHCCVDALIAVRSYFRQSVAKLRRAY